MKTSRQIQTLPFLERCQQTDDSVTKTSSLSGSAAPQEQAAHLHLEMHRHLDTAGVAVVGKVEQTIVAFVVGCCTSADSAVMALAWVAPLHTGSSLVADSTTSFAFVVVAAAAVFVAFALPFSAPIVTW